jgi:hypothetical protein
MHLCLSVNYVFHCTKLHNFTLTYTGTHSRLLKREITNNNSLTPVSTSIIVTALFFKNFCKEFLCPFHGNSTNTLFTGTRCQKQKRSEPECLHLRRIIAFLIEGPISATSARTSKHSQSGRQASGQADWQSQSGGPTDALLTYSMEQSPS